MNTTYTATSAQIGTRNTYEILTGTVADYTIRYTHEEKLAGKWRVLWSYDENAASAYVADLLEELAYGLAYDLQEFTFYALPWWGAEPADEETTMATVQLLLDGETESIEEVLEEMLAGGPDRDKERAEILLNEVREWKR